jgi:hypothetical protein
LKVAQATPWLIDRGDLLAAARVGRPRQDHRIALMSVWPGQRDAQLF